MITTLHIGATGDDVTRLQMALNKVGGCLEVTGCFDRRTQASVMRFQVKNRLIVSGAYDAAMQALLPLESAPAKGIVLPVPQPVTVESVPQPAVVESVPQPAVVEPAVVEPAVVEVDAPVKKKRKKKATTDS